MKEFSHSSNEQAEPFEISRLIRNTVTVATNEWRYVAEVELQLDDDVPPVKGIREHISQALLNLIVNAAHAIDEANSDAEVEGVLGKISISCAVSGSDVEVRITDTGTGIPEELHTKIIDPFFFTKEVDKGTGQGLSLSHKFIVDGHGGSISFDTKSGEGTTFILRLPIEGKQE
ncbi:MAG: sensor histidine kinase [Gammaproteobacteria bacterium]